MQVTHIYIYCGSPINLLMSLALRASRKPGQLQHTLNRANMIRSTFFFHPFPYPHSSWLFFFLQSRVKSPKRVSLEHGFMEEANRLIPLGHELIKSKTWGQIRPCGWSRDECSPTVCSDKRMIKIKAGHAAQNTQLWWQNEDNGQREGRWSEQTAVQPQSLFSFPGYETVHPATPWRRVSSVLSTNVQPSILLQSLKTATICHFQVSLAGFSEGK